MFEPVNKRPWTILNIIPCAVKAIALHNSNNFVISLASINHTKTPNGKGSDNNVSMAYDLFGQNTNIQRIIIPNNRFTACTFRAKFSNAF